MDQGRVALRARWAPPLVRWVGDHQDQVKSVMGLMHWRTPISCNPSQVNLRELQSLTIEGPVPKFRMEISGLHRWAGMEKNYATLRIA